MLTYSGLRKLSFVHSLPPILSSTRINKVVLESLSDEERMKLGGDGSAGVGGESFDGKGVFCGIVDDDCEAYVEGMDRMERFLR